MQSTPSHTLNIASEIEIQTINNAQCEDSTFNLDTSESFTGGDECQLSSTETMPNKHLTCQGKDKETKRNGSKMFVKEDVKKEKNIQTEMVTEYLCDAQLKPAVNAIYFQRLLVNDISIAENFHS